MCNENRGLSKTRFLMDIVAIFTKIIKSVGFNSLIFVIGFIFGFGSLHLISHISWVRNKNYETVNRIEEYVEKQKEINGKIENELTELKLKIIHQNYHN